MEKTIDNAEWKEVSRFDNLIEPIVSLVKDNWDIQAAPKGYQEYRDQYEEYDDMDDEKYALKFDGLLNTSATSSPINDRLSMPQVAYDDTQQGRDPLQTLLGSVLSYGIAIGRRQEKTDPNDFDEYRHSRVQDFLEDIIEDRFDTNDRIETAKMILEVFKRIKK